MLNLSKKSLELLKRCLVSHRPNLLIVIKDTYSSKITEDIYNELRDAVSDELLQNGFNGDVPNKYGIELENLIDEIGRLFM